MKENVLSVHLKHIEANDVVPNVAELNEVLPMKGFRPLTEASPTTLPVGSVVAIYNLQKHTMLFGVVWEHTYAGFNYLPGGELKNITPNDEDLEHMRKKYDYESRLYKVITHLPVVDGKPQLELFLNAIEEAGFRSLNEASPEDLPAGCLAFLYDANSYSLAPVIVRVLSMQFEGDHRFLYWYQSAITAGTWHSGVIMDKLNSFKNYSYLVVS